MKRKLDYDAPVSSRTRSKKPKLCSEPLPKSCQRSEYVSASHTRNYMLRDTLVDWLKKHGRHVVKVPETPKKDDGFIKFIMERGIEFEEKLVKHINDTILPVEYVSDKITDESVEKTIELMKAGVPIIHSAPLRNTYNKTQGVADLLVRSDELYKIVNECPLTLEEEITSAPKLGKHYHYVVIDIKFSTLPLRADGVHLLNSGSYPAYKAQILIYNDAVARIQGYKPRCAFIMGRRWTYTTKGIRYSKLECLDRLGVIDYKGVDKPYVAETRKALRWVRNNRKNGHKWSVFPPSRKELYPNMCKDSGKWQKHKEKIADQIGEISNIWYCGEKHRNNGFANGIKSWRDPRCTSANIGMRGVRAAAIDKILDINRQNVDKIRPKRIKHNLFKWKDECNEIFVDFETLADIFAPFSNLPVQEHTDMIFMIGVYCKTGKGGGWEYKNFICKEPTYDEEYRIMNEFTELVKKLKYPKMWYWFAEKRIWKKSENRQYDISESEDKCEHIETWTDKWGDWADLCDVFKKEPIVVNGCFKFGLKAVASAMKKHKLITTGIESECDSGMTAMVQAWKCYKNYSDPANCDVMNDIATYNKFDCCVLQDILSYLRSNHVERKRFLKMKNKKNNK